MSLAHPLENKLAKGDFAIAHIQKTMTSLLAGHQIYSRYYVVRIAKATREGQAKAFTDWDCPTAPAKAVDRFTTIWTLPEPLVSKLPVLFAQQMLDFTGYKTKGDLKAAIDSVVA